MPMQSLLGAYNRLSLSHMANSFIWLEWTKERINDNLEVTEEANVDEAIPIDIKKERNTQAFKETMNIDIDKD